MTTTRSDQLVAECPEIRADQPVRACMDPLDEPRHVAQRREHAQRREDRDLAALESPRRAAVYRRILVNLSDLTDAEHRLLCLLSTRWGSRLENCFPSQKKIRQRSGWRRTKLKRVLAALERKGFIARIPLTSAEDGRFAEVEAGGRFISATGIQFLLPPGIVGRAWVGPRTWTNRLYAGRQRRAQ